MARFSVDIAPAKKENILTFDDVRISVLSDKILRVEKDKDGCFCDLATQTVLNRNLQDTEFTSSKDGDKVLIATKCAEFLVNVKTLEVAVKLAG